MNGSKLHALEPFYYDKSEGGINSRSGGRASEMDYGVAAH